MIASLRTTRYLGTQNTVPVLDLKHYEVNSQLPLFHVLADRRLRAWEGMMAMAGIGSMSSKSVPDAVKTGRSCACLLTGDIGQ